MIQLEKEVELLFSLCEETNKVSRSVDMYREKKYLMKVRTQAEKVFMYLENAAAMQNLTVQFTHKEVVVKLAFVIMKCIYLYKGSYPSAALNKMSFVLMNEADYIHKFGNEGTWVKNDVIFTKAIASSMKKAHPELIEKCINDIMYIFSSPAILTQNTPEYMNRFIHHYRVVLNNVLAAV